jgi:transcriptional regulator with XRE-family HTH domain
MGEFSKRLNEMMELRGMRQIDLANATGLDRAMIHGYVSGKNVPQESRLQLIATALNCDPLWLAGYDGIDEDEDKEFMTMFRSLSAEDKKTVTKILQYLTDANKKDDK